MDQPTNGTPIANRRRWLLGLEPIFEGGWLHKCQRARTWDVEDELVALALLGDVSIDLSETKSAPVEVVIKAYALLRDIDVLVPEGTRVELTGRAHNDHLNNHVAPVPEQHPDRVVRYRINAAGRRDSADRRASAVVPPGAPSPPYTTRRRQRASRPAAGRRYGSRTTGG